MRDYFIFDNTDEVTIVNADYFVVEDGLITFYKIKSVLFEGDYTVGLFKVDDVKRITSVKHENDVAKGNS